MMDTSLDTGQSPPQHRPAMLYLVREGQVDDQVRNMMGWRGEGFIIGTLTHETASLHIIKYYVDRNIFILI